MYHIARYDEVHRLAFHTLIMSPTTWSSTSSTSADCNTANKALKVLQVKTAPDTTTAMAIGQALAVPLCEEDPW